MLRAPRPLGTNRSSGTPKQSQLGIALPLLLCLRALDLEGIPGPYSELTCPNSGYLARRPLFRGISLQV